MTERKRGTETSNFGVSRRESHDASAFYSRFPLPEISTDESVTPLAEDVVDRIYVGDARNMSAIADNSIALIVTSPPYFAGKQYEEALGEGHVPADYVEYLKMLHDVFAECARVLEPGGRIAVNVANLGRKPYRSLAADVIQILQDQLRLLLRGEIVWIKSQGASGSCAWGSFQRPNNPVLRDLTERVIVASKGRFDRALSPRDRQRRGLPYQATIFRDDFMEATVDVWEVATDWEISPESAHRVGHPAPFPVELPERLIRLYTYRDDVVLDPFIGSGTTALAALRNSRRYVGYDTDPGYVRSAEDRIKEEIARRSRRTEMSAFDALIQSVPGPVPDDEDYQSRAVREGRRAREIARAVLMDCGFEITHENLRLRGGVEVNFAARDERGLTWFFDVSGAFTTPRGGLRRTDTLWKALGKASVVQSSMKDAYRLVFLTTDLPPRASSGGKALRAAHGKTFFDAIRMLSVEGQQRLSEYSKGEAPLPGGLLFPSEEE